MKRAISAIGFVVLVLGTAQFAFAEIDSNSITNNGLQYYIQTDKSIYDLGEDVEMLYRVTNLTDVNVTFSFPAGPSWNFWVEKDEENIWSAVEGWYGMGTTFTLAPGGYREFPDWNPPYIWDMRDNENNLINVGEYDVIGGFDAGAPGNYYYYSRVSVPITIVPEPATFFLLALGGLFLKKGRI